ncbi:MAG: WYL domain-containing protein [Verrucomicrobia bacterium]|nr:WYL domain-containing protein [Verrucomicrobiota bacterium]
MARKQQLSRPPLERIFTFHKLIQEGRYPNCSLLARMFEIHLRTVNRDLDFMRDRLRLPLEYDPQRRGFFYSKPVEHFPLVPMTESEVFALLVAHKAIAQYRGTPFEHPLRTAFRKLAWQLDRNAPYGFGNPDEMLSFRPLAPEETDLESFQILTRALREKRGLSFTYRNLGAKTVRKRRVRPYHLACIENHWYLLAFDVDRQDMRTFVLTRLSDPEITDDRFVIPESFDPNHYLKGAFSAFKGKADYEVVIDFDIWATDLIRGRQWHASQEITLLPQGCSRMRLRLSSIEEMVGWVLSWGAHATVVRPIELVNRVRETGRAVVDRYASVAAETPSQPAGAGMDLLVEERRPGQPPARTGCPL